MELSHILNHLGEDRDEYRGAVSPPIFQTSNFAFPTVEAVRKGLAGELDNSFYTRGNNPTIEILRKKMAALEGSEDALVFASGVAAISAAVLVEVKQGDHIVSVERPYSWTNVLFSRWLPRFGVTTTFVDGTDVENFRAAITDRTKLIYLESPNSHTFELQDIRSVVDLAQSRDLVTIIDNSYSSPLFQRPLDLGVDTVVHSASKYLSGHSDVVAGVLCASRDRVERIFENEFMTLGGIISPQDGWLMLRGLRTLELRMNRIGRSAQKVAEFLDGHDLVEKVNYPFLPSHRQYDLARSQMSSGAGLMSFQLKARDFGEVETFVDGLERFLLACSWGGHESLCFPICAMYETPSDEVEGLPWNLIRLYIGLEEVERLIEDLNRGLERLARL